ncbi:hypothetical protein RJ639_038193 [Escallonia herrerae]|uniref:Uncharacterized protein n=1 Tax=Escallonia herrerae TaxID=1293975 RepID=A0AA88WNJ6_9ASTE|nr:hypothetical protein RJ639_038193 [Escallonia herrerae]
MISSLTRRLTDLQQHVGKPGATDSSRHMHLNDDGQFLDNGDDHGGIRIITLAGSNLGATMRSELDLEKPSHDQEIEENDEPLSMSTFVNSNFQAINNSIMLGGSYSTNDPGVHVDIPDYMEEQQAYHNKHEKKGSKKKDKEASKSDHHTQVSD